VTLGCGRFEDRDGAGDAGCGHACADAPQRSSGARDSSAGRSDRWGVDQEPVYDIGRFGLHPMLRAVDSLMAPGTSDVQCRGGDLPPCEGDVLSSRRRSPACWSAVAPVRTKPDVGRQVGSVLVQGGRQRAVRLQLGLPQPRQRRRITSRTVGIVTNVTPHSRRGEGTFGAVHTARGHKPCSWGWRTEPSQSSAFRLSLPKLARESGARARRAGAGCRAVVRGLRAGRGTGAWFGFGYAEVGGDRARLARPLLEPMLGATIDELVANRMAPSLVIRSRT
jgi:hypothetical protein